MKTKNWKVNSQSRKNLINNMIKYGTGASADSIMEMALGINQDKYSNHPSDFHDLIRCISVVDIFNIDIRIMKGTNAEWNGFVDHWDILVKLCENDEFVKVKQVIAKILKTADK